MVISIYELHFQQNEYAVIHSKDMGFFIIDDNSPVHNLERVCYIL